MSTIFALSTAPAKSAIAVIRISGLESFKVINEMTRLSQIPASRFMKNADIFDKNGILIDKAMLACFKGPKSFTGEDMVELHMHGSMAVIEKCIASLQELSNFRMAEPGEFSRRAFDNGKMDLTEVEGLSDLISSQTETQRILALSQYQVRSEWRSEILKNMALMEAIIDFSEDEAFEVPLHSIAKNLMALREEIAGKLSNRVGETIRNGIQITLVGAPNAGKSSFMNLISERKVSIVSAMPGTTRDVISTLLNMNGFLVRMSDTAGLRESSDPIEMEGIEMTCESVEKSDFIFFIVDATNPSCQYEHILNDPRTIVLYNKIDLLDSNSLQELKRSLKNNEFLISCSSKEGFNEFLQKLPDLLKKNYTLSDDLISQHRHKVLLKECIAQLSMFEESVEDVVLAAEHLRYAASAIGKITGIIDTEEILSVIFKEFCIGK